MKISVLLITFNHEQYIRECLEGILIQETPFERELIVSDDCSTDKTLEIIEEVLKSRDWPYRVLKSDQNMGLSRNYRRGFEACNGEYIALIDGDDYWTDPGRLVKHVSFLDRHRECVMSFNRLAVYSQALSRFDVHGWQHEADFVYVTTSILARGNVIGNFSTCVARRSAVNKIRPDFYGRRSIGDWGFGMVMGQFGLLAKLKDVMSVYRVHGSGVWSSLNDSEKNQRLISAIDRHNEYLNYVYNEEFLAYKAQLMEASTSSEEPNVFVKSLVRMVKAVLPLSLRRDIKKILVGGV